MISISINASDAIRWYEFLFCSNICCWACTQPPDQTKKYRNQKFGDTCPSMILSKNIFLFFSIKSPWDSLVSKNCPITMVFFQLPCLAFKKKILTSGDLLFIHWTGSEWFLLILVMVSLYSYSSYASGIWWNGQKVAFEKVFPPPYLFPVLCETFFH